MTTEDKELVFLQSIAEGLTTLQKNATLLDKNLTQFPIHLLSIALQADKKGQARNVMISPYDFGEEESFYKHTYIQIYSQVPTELTPQQMATLAMCLPEINQQIALGHFGIQYNEYKMYFKYILLVAEEEKEVYKKVAEILEILEFTLDIMEPTIDMIASNNSVDEILARYAID